MTLNLQRFVAALLVGLALYPLAYAAGYVTEWAYLSAWSATHELLDAEAGALLRLARNRLRSQ